MTPIEFEHRMQKVLSQFKKSNYSQDRMTLIFEEVKNISANDFDRIVVHFLGNMRSAPLVQDFKKAIQDLGIRKLNNATYIPESSSSHSSQPDFEYCLMPNVWANEKYIFMRGPKPGFIIKADAPEHPLVKADIEFKSERIREMNKYLSNNQYGEYLKIKNGNVPHGTLKIVNPLEGA